MTRSAFREAARDQRVCAVTGEGGRAFHAHHAVRESDVKHHGGDPEDPRNALRLKWEVHLEHHWGNDKVPLTALTDENIAFAFEILGEYAADYLRQRYQGEDARVTDRLLHSPSDAAKGI